MASALSGRPPKRWGNRSSSAAPQGAYPCSGKDEWCTLSVQTDAPVEPPAKLGGHTREVLLDWLGLDEVAIDDLEVRAAFW